MGELIDKIKFLEWRLTLGETLGGFAIVAAVVVWSFNTFQTNAQAAIDKDNQSKLEAYRVKIEQFQDEKIKSLEDQISNYGTLLQNISDDVSYLRGHKDGSNK